MREGSQAAYRAVGELVGEQHVVRTDLASGDGTAPGDAIASLAHLTDLHVTDPQSPARFEYVQREWRDPRFRELLPMWRPQETLNMHAAAAMVGTINHLRALPITGTPLQLVAMTGDAIDNAQHNELTNFIALMSGGLVHPDSGQRGYEGVQHPAWPAEYCWKPDAVEDADPFQSLLGFPHRPGLLAQAMRPFRTKGLALPWLGCYGNHEQLCQGVGIVTPELARAMIGSRKPSTLPEGLDRDLVVQKFVDHPEIFMTGAPRVVSPDPDRRPMSRGDFIDACQVRDMGRVRYITLDTVCTAGGANGTIDQPQLRWLGQRLDEAPDRYVVILSHHGYDTLSNPCGERRAGELLDLLQRHPNVVLWLNGHIHANRITARGSFWEVTTSSLVDWPCQARVVEIYRTRDGRLAIGCTMLDHDGFGLSGLHRELAGNAPLSGFDSVRAGTPADRNAILLLGDPL